MIGQYIKYLPNYDDFDPFKHNEVEASAENIAYDLLNNDMRQAIHDNKTTPKIIVYAKILLH